MVPAGLPGIGVRRGTLARASMAGKVVLPVGLPSLPERQVPLGASGRVAALLAVPPGLALAGMGILVYDVKGLLGSQEECDEPLEATYSGPG